MRQRRSFNEPRKLLKWWTYSQAQRDRILHEFWADYFRDYPEDGSIDELNVMRRAYEHAPGPDYETFKRNWKPMSISG